MGSFKKIVSNLAFNPGMFDQLAFYSRRLKQEESVRRLGLVLIIFTMFIQLFAAMVPPEKSLAASNNDVIRGGVSTVGELRSKYFAQADVRDLYNRFGLTGGDLDAQSAQNTSFNFKDQGSKGTRTVGRVNFASTQDHNLGSFSGSTFYSRSAAEWSGSTPAYFFGQHKGTDNNFYYVWVLKDCGNIAYRAANAVDSVGSKTESAPPPPVAAPAPPPPPIATPSPPPPPTTTAVQSVSCTSLIANKITGTKSLKVSFTAAYSASPPNIVSGLTFNFGDNSSVRQTGTTIDHTYINNTDQPVTYTAFVVVHSALGDKRSPACEVTITLAPEVCDSKNTDCIAPKRTKRVQNITQNLTSTTTLLNKAHASDVMEYSLVTTNTNGAPITNYTVEDYIGDLLDYSNLDQAFLKTQGGIFSPEKKTITWTNQTIKAHSEIKKDFRVVLKNPLPSTNRPNSTATDFDCKMQNGYGNEVIVPVDCAVVKNIEQLPNTGPGTAIVAAFSFSTLSGYFVARARLLAKELGIIKRGWRA